MMMMMMMMMIIIIIIIFICSDKNIRSQACNFLRRFR